MRSDQIGKPTRAKARAAFPSLLRKVRYFDADTGRDFVFLTNHLQIPALTVAKIYRLRWRIELFFRWIKGHLRIKHYYGTSPNAVKTQIWIAVASYLICPQHPRTFRTVGRRRTLFGNGNPHHCDKDAGLIRTVSSARIAAKMSAAVHWTSRINRPRAHSSRLFRCDEIQKVCAKNPAPFDTSSNMTLYAGIHSRGKVLQKMIQHPDRHFLLHLQIPHSK